MPVRAGEGIGSLAFANEDSQRQLRLIILLLLPRCTPERCVFIVMRDGGMIAVVVLALLMVPVFFVTVQRFFARDRETTENAAAGERYGPPAQPIQ